MEESSGGGSPAGPGCSVSEVLAGGRRRTKTLRPWAGARESMGETEVGEAHGNERTGLEQQEAMGDLS